MDGDIAGYGGALIQKARIQAGIIAGFFDEMDAENCSALTLYTSLGFIIEGENIIYEKELI
ncbi:MAG: hypothetical protein HXS54_14695 [Theionarchaea archaeon]|nr:hypothetical protein [Theionarchaea archaeon]